MSKSEKWGGSRQGAGRPRHSVKVPVQTYTGEGTKIEVLSVSEKAHFYHMEGQSLTSVDDLYRGSIDELLAMLLRPIGLTIDDHKIIPVSQQ